MKVCTALCASCNSLIIDILTWNFHDESRWSSLRTDYVSLIYCQTHLSGSIERLKASSYKCDLCQLIHGQVEVLSPKANLKSYFLFATDLRKRRAEIHVAVDEVSHFVKANSMQRQSRVLVFSGCAGHLTGLPFREPRWSDAKPYLPVLPFSSLDSTAAISLVKSWLEECTMHHIRCVRTATRLPTRVLDLGKLMDEHEVALYVTGSETPHYTTLSYSWGRDLRLETHRITNDPSIPSSKLSVHHLVMRRYAPSPDQSGRQMSETTCSPDKIPFHFFPATLRDALLVTRRLGFRYIWIDALCIIQNDAKDFAEQSVKMAEIYRNSELTISASSSQSTNEGMFQAVRDDTLGLFNTRNEECENVHIRLGEKPQLPGIEDFHISTRGWTFQERLVSPATIHYTNQGLFWECAQVQRASHHDRFSCYPLKARWQALQNTQTKESKVLYASWTEWANVYSGRTLSRDSDKLTAMAGIAKVIAQHLNLTDSYFAGLWKEHFLSGLLWRRFGRTKTLVPIPNVAPSWSWASVQGQLEGPNAIWNPSAGKGQALRIISLTAEEEHRGSFGSLSSKSKSSPRSPAQSATLCVEGLLQKLTIDRHKQAGERPQAWRERGVLTGFVNTKNVECMLDQWSLEDDRFLDCYCLRIGSQTVDGNKVTDHFLLLEKIDQFSDRYVRIGTARCDENFDKGKAIPGSGLLFSPIPQKLIIL